MGRPPRRGAAGLALFDGAPCRCPAPIRAAMRRPGWASLAAVCLVSSSLRAQDSLRPEEHAAKKAGAASAVDSSSPYAQALRLARMLRDDATIAKLLRLRAAR